MLKNFKIKNLLSLLGPIILIYILTRINYGFLFEQIKLIKLPFLIAAAIVAILGIVSRSLKWRLILNNLNIKISKLDGLNLFWLGLYAGIITPGRLGELIKVYFLKLRNHAPLPSFLSIFVDRMIDIMFLLGLGLLVSIFYLKGIVIQVLALIIILMLAITLFLLVLDQRTGLHRFFNVFIKRFFSFDLAKYSNFTFLKLWKGIKRVKIGDVLIYLAYLLFSWFLYFFSSYLIALALALNLSFFNLSAILVVVAIVSILPITIAGIGTREAVIIYFFSLLGFSSERALIFSFFIFINDLVTIAVGIIPYYRESILLGKFKN
ncbi:MAG: lysylphosphatidylglycerol synthase transmembrane domain-containing protein [Patescibacteria group bacterium]